MCKSYKFYILLLLTLKLSSPLAVGYNMMKGSQISYLPFNSLQESDRTTLTESDLNLKLFLHHMTLSNSTPEL